MMTDKPPFSIETDEFHVLKMGGTMFFLDGETRREVELMIENGDDYCQITDLAGCEIFVVPHAVLGLWSSSPDSRSRDRAMQKALELEDPTG